MKYNISQKTKDIILSAIEEIIYNGGEDNFVIFDLGLDYFIQIAASRGAYEVYCEAVGDNYLDQDRCLTEEQKENLLRLKWRIPNEPDENYSLKHKVDSVKSREELAELIYITAIQAYNIDVFDAEKINLNLE